MVTCAEIARFSDISNNTHWHWAFVKRYKELQTPTSGWLCVLSFECFFFVIHFFHSPNLQISNENKQQLGDHHHHRVRRKKSTISIFSQSSSSSTTQNSSSKQCFDIDNLKVSQLLLFDLYVDYYKRWKITKNKVFEGERNSRQENDLLTIQKSNLELLKVIESCSEIISASISHLLLGARWIEVWAFTSVIFVETWELKGKKINFLWSFGLVDCVGKWFPYVFNGFFSATFFSLTREIHQASFAFKKISRSNRRNVWKELFSNFAPSHKSKIHFFEHITSIQRRIPWSLSTS